jgi:hypothetical protein
MYKLSKDYTSRILTKIQVLSFIITFSGGTFGVRIEKNKFASGDLKHKHCTDKYQLSIREREREREREKKS